jgi:hypothetical protein
MATSRQRTSDRVVEVDALLRDRKGSRTALRTGGGVEGARVPVRSIRVAPPGMPRGYGRRLSRTGTTLSPWRRSAAREDPRACATAIASQADVERRDTRGSPDFMSKRRSHRVNSVVSRVHWFKMPPSGTHGPKVSESPTIASYPCLSNGPPALGTCTLSLQNRNFMAPALAHRTQEVGGSNPPSSISASPRLRGLLETVPTLVWPSGGWPFRRPRR